VLRQVHVDGGDQPSIIIIKGLKALSIPVSIASRPDLEPTQPPNQRVLAYLSPGVKQQERESDHSPPSNAEVKSGRAVTLLLHQSSWCDA
jgi:hypothetical protein